MHTPVFFSKNKQVSTYLRQTLKRLGAKEALYNMTAGESSQGQARQDQMKTTMNHHLTPPSKVQSTSDTSGVVVAELTSKITSDGNEERATGLLVPSSQN